MKPSLMGLLACPACAGDLSLGAEETVDGEVENGRIRCHGCGEEFPVRRGIPRFGRQPTRREARVTVERFGYQWRQFRDCFPQYRAAFLDWMAPLGETDFRDRVILDAGCGMGRFTEVAASLGASTVVGVDLSESVEVAQEMARRRPNVHILQADLLSLPFRRMFDLVFAIGVLHHLPDGEEGLVGLVRHVRPGGLVHAWVYGREGNEWLLRWVDPVRRGLTSRLPPPVLRFLAWTIAVPLHVALPLYRSGLGPRLPYGPYLAWLGRFPFRHTQQVIFDHLSAPIARYYSREEFCAWFERAGLVDVVVTSRNANSWRGTGRLPAGANDIHAQGTV